MVYIYFFLFRLVGVHDKKSISFHNNSKSIAYGYGVCVPPVKKKKNRKSDNTQITLSKLLIDKYLM